MFEKVEAFYRPGTIREALRLLRAGNGRARIVAGGTDVAVEADRSIRVLIDITHAGLNYIRRKGTTCHIGATTTMTALESSPLVRNLAGGILAQAAASSGSVQIRNVGTIGGNLANASPAAETATALLALDAEVLLAGAHGRRKAPVAAICSDLRKILLDQALIVEIAIPQPPRGARWSFQKLGRTQVDLSLVNAAAGLQLDSKGRVRFARLAFGAVAPTPIRAERAEHTMLGRTLDEALFEEVCDEVAREVTPITDVRASAEYRRTIARVLARRALEECSAGWGCLI